MYHFTEKRRCYLGVGEVPLKTFGTKSTLSCGETGTADTDSQAIGDWVGDC